MGDTPASAARREMVDRVAWAICQSLGGVWDWANSGARWRAVRAARAAIAAMAEPTPAMLNAAHFDGPVGSMLAYDRIWQRMIDEALRGG